GRVEEQTAHLQTERELCTFVVSRIESDLFYLKREGVGFNFVEKPGDGGQTAKTIHPTLECHVIIRIVLPLGLDRSDADPTVLRPAIKSLQHSAFCLGHYFGQRISLHCFPACANGSFPLQQLRAPSK